MREYDPKTNTPNEAEPDHFLRKLKEEFQWTCAEDSGNISWEAADTWEHPDTNKYSSYEEAWESLLDDDTFR